MSEKRKQMLETLADCMSKMTDGELEKIQIFSAGVAAGASIKSDEAKEAEQPKEKEETER